MPYETIISKTIQRAGAIATITVSIGIAFMEVALTNGALATSTETQTQDLPSPRNVLLCPFSGTEVTFQVMTPVSADTPLEESHDATFLDTTANVLAHRIHNLELELEPAQTATTIKPPNHIVVQLPGTIPLTVLGNALQVLTQNGQLTFRPQRTDTSEEQLSTLIQAREDFEGNSSNAHHLADLEQSDNLDQLNEAIATLFGPSAISGDRIQTAAALTSASGQWQIDIEFDQQGAEQFARLTKELAGTGLALGIFWNNTLLSAPIVASNYAMTGIMGGQASLSGNFTGEEARAIALQLRQPPLPTPVELAQIQLTQRNEPCSSQE